MEISLVYCGNIASRNRAVAELKHDIRCELHPQLKRFWDFAITKANERRSPNSPIWTPFKKVRNDGDVSLLTKHGDWTFAPTVSDMDGWYARCRLSFDFFEQDVRRGIGDIDNKVKTLLDALRIPTDTEATDLKNSVEQPFYCLLEDDKLVSSYSVERRTVFMSKQSQTPAKDFVIINAKVFASRHTTFNSIIW